MKNDLLAGGWAPVVWYMIKVYNKAIWKRSEVLVARTISRFLPVLLCDQPRKVQLKDLTFMVHPAFQLKYQSHNIKAAALLTLTEVQLKWRCQSHWCIDNVHSDTKEKVFFFPCMRPACTFWIFIHRASRVIDRLHSLFLSFLQSI